MPKRVAGSYGSSVFKGAPSPCLQEAKAVI